MSRWPLSRSARFRRLSPVQTFQSSPCWGLNASSGRPASISSGVVPSRLFPTRMWWSRGESGLPGSSASSHRLTRHSSAAIGFMSTPYRQRPMTSRSACW